MAKRKEGKRISMTEKWIDAKKELPLTSEVVLAVKQLKNGTRSICMARCFRDYKYANPVTHECWTGPYWTCGGSNNIIYWMELPSIPEV